MAGRGRGNGNGNGHGAGNGNGANGGNVTAVSPNDDPMVLQLLGLYVVQKLGQGTLEQVQQRLREKLQFEVHLNTLEIALDALRRRGFLSLNNGADEQGNRIDLFGIKSLKFQSPPEVAHYADLLPKLLTTPEAEAIKSGLDEKEHQGASKEKAERLGYRDYYVVKATFRTLDPLLGGMPKSPYCEALLKKFGKRTEADLYFDRDPNDGSFCISADQVAGWVRTNIRLANKGDVSIYIGCSAAKFNPETTVQHALPVIDNGQGKGITKYEAVPAGTVFTITFDVPAEGVMTPNEFHTWLAFAGLQPIRGISPARGKRYGRMLLTGFEVVREMRKDMRGALEMALANVPEDIRKEHGTAVAAMLNAAESVGTLGAKRVKTEAQA